jgi:nucleotidyltransferase/DNA polymerase involved in DNA repair
MERMILHVDMDAFFASVEELSSPPLRGKPVMVCGDPNGRSVVAAASYPAREFGVSSGMPVTTARALCPNGIFIPGDPQKYIFTSLRVRKLCQEFTPVVEPFSIDEFFLDITDTAERYGGAFDLADKLKERIRKATGLKCTVKIFGVVGEMLCRAARGEDDSPVIDEEHQPKAKSIGNEYTLAEDTGQRKKLERTLMGLSAKVGRRLRKAGFRARTITVKIRFGNFDTITRAATSGQGLRLDQEIFDEARKVLRSVKLNQPVRLLGVSASNLTTTCEKQMELFGISCPLKLERVTEAVDRLRDRFGEYAITWGSLVKEEVI